MRWSVPLLLCCCANQATQRLAEQSADKALTQLATPWAEDGPPTLGLSTTTDDLKNQLTTASASLLLLWRITPHDPATNPETQTILASVTPYRIQMDKAPQEEFSFLLQTYSGELFVLLFTQLQEGTWAFVDSYRLPSLARKESCRAPSDGVARIRNIQATSNAPAFLWVEVQASDQCTEAHRTERTLHLLALQSGRLRPVLETTLQQTRTKTSEAAGEQLNSQATLDSKRNTLLISGARRMFPVTGGAGQEATIRLWYYFDGARYQAQK